MLTVLRKLAYLPNRMCRRLMVVLTLWRWKNVGKNVTYDVRSSDFSFETIILGDNVSINKGAYMRSTHGQIVIEKNVMFGPYVSIYGGNHIDKGRDIPMVTISKNKYHDDGLIHIGEGTWVGGQAIILPNVSIGKGCIIGAGSVVNTDIPDYSIYAGVPAKLIKMR